MFLSKCCHQSNTIRIEPDYQIDPTQKAALSHKLALRGNPDISIDFPAKRPQSFWSAFLRYTKNEERKSLKKIKCLEKDTEKGEK